MVENGTTACAWDTVIPFAPLWEAYKRGIKPNGAIVLFGSQPFTSALISSNPSEFRYEWIWEKNNPSGFLDARRKPLKDHENITVFYGKSPTYNPQGVRQGKPNSGGMKNRRGSLYSAKKVLGDYTGCQIDFPRSVLKIGAGVGQRLHSTQKPVRLLEYLIRTYTNEGDTVLDSCMGSASTAIACMRTGRKFIGIERDDTYFEVSCQRVKDEQRQGRLFTV